MIGYNLSVITTCTLTYVEIIPLMLVTVRLTDSLFSVLRAKGQILSGSWTKHWVIGKRS